MTDRLQDEALAAKLDPLITVAMQTTFNKAPYEWQKPVIRRLVQMTMKVDGVKPSAVLLVRSTGGGKSMTRNTAGRMLCAVTLTISPLLSLDAQQATTLEHLFRDDPDSGAMAYNLDEVARNDKAVAKLKKLLSSLEADTEQTIFLFASPQTITAKKSVFHGLLHELINKGLLRLLCLDEVHLFVQFGLRFRPEFVELKKELLNHCNHAGVPTLMMTATATPEVKELLGELTGFTFDPSNVFWPTHSGVQRRSVFLSFRPSEQPKRIVKQLCEEMLDNPSDGGPSDNPSDGGPSDRRLVLYTNTKDRAKDFDDDLGSFLDETGLVGDIVVIQGDLRQEEKFHAAKVFTGPDEASDDPSVLKEMLFHSRILIATSGSASSGLDSDKVFRVVRDGFPRSVLDLIQELGRAGRRPSANSDSDRYEVLYSLKSYTDLIRMIHEPASTTAGDESNFLMKEDEHRQLQLKELQRVLELIVLQRRCLHQQLEAICCNPDPDSDNNDEPLPACGSHCSYCVDQKLSAKSKQQSYVRPVDRSEARNMIVRLFVEGSGKGMSLSDDLPKALRDTTNSGQRLYRGAKDTTPPLTDIKALLLQLLASRALTAVYDSATKTVKASLTLADDMSLYISKEEAWQGVQTIT